MWLITAGRRAGVPPSERGQEQSMGCHPLHQHVRDDEAKVRGLMFS